MSKHNKVLYVASLNPFVLGGGGQATRAYMDVTLDYFGRDNVTIMISDEIIIPEAYADLRYVRVPKRSSIQSAIGYVTGILSRFTLPLISYVKKHRDEFNICIINGSLAGGKAVKEINHLGVKTVMIYHNYEVEYHRDNKSKESLKGHFLAGIKYCEKLSYKNASLNLFLTKDDVLLFEKEYGEASGPYYIIGTFDYKNQDRVKLSGKHKEYDIVISGSLVNYQTTVGVKDFYNSFLKNAEEIIPNLKVLLTGRNPSEEIRRIQETRPDIFTIVPNPEDIYDVVQRGSIYLCPTCIGGGLKLRAMDGLRCGLPILTHKVSARGYNYYFDKPYYKVYDNETTFRDGLKELLSWITNNPTGGIQINRDYYMYFGYNAGLNRFKDALSLIE